MVEHNEEFGPSTPPPPPEEIPDEPVFDEPEAPPLEPEFAGETPVAFEPTPASFEAKPASFEAKPASFEARPAYTPPPPADNDAPKHPIFPMIIGAAMILALLGAWGLNQSKTEGTAPAASASAPAPAPEPTPAETAAAPASAPAADEVNALQATIDGLKADLKALQDKLDAMPKPAPPPDLGPISGKVAEIAKQTEAVVALPGKVDEIDQRVGGLDKSLASLRDEIVAVKGEVKKEAAPAVAAEAAKPEDASVADAAVGQGVDLFKAGKYKEANDAFRKLTETYPDDARVWYYAALSRGSATNDWGAETTRLVEKGAEREKAGSPDSAKVDTVFNDLNPAFKPWLDAYRKKAKAR